MKSRYDKTKTSGSVCVSHHPCQAWNLLHHLTLPSLYPSHLDFPPLQSFSSTFVCLSSSTLLHCPSYTASTPPSLPTFFFHPSHLPPHHPVLRALSPCLADPAHSYPISPPTLLYHPTLASTPPTLPSNTPPTLHYNLFHLALPPISLFSYHPSYAASPSHHTPPFLPIFSITPSSYQLPPTVFSIPRPYPISSPFPPIPSLFASSHPNSSPILHSSSFLPTSLYPRRLSFPSRYRERKECVRRSHIFSWRTLSFSRLQKNSKRGSYRRESVMQKLVTYSF